MNRAEASRLVASILAACPAQSVRLNEERQLAMAVTFLELLGDLTYDECNAALRVLLQTRSWMPSVADIRGTALELRRGPVKSGAEAWGSVLKAIREQGSWRSPGVDFVFNDPVTARCVSALGWQDLCASENTIADRARFIDAYDQMAAQDRKEHQSPMLGAAKQMREIERGNGAVSIAALLPKGEA